MIMSLADDPKQMSKLQLFHSFIGLLHSITLSVC